MLHSLAGGDCRLTRTLSLPCGLQAQLVCEGSDPGALLQAMAAVPLQRQVRVLAPPAGAEVARAESL